jgi:hypothetical protein
MAEEKEEKTVTISFRATPSEAAAMDTEAAKNGLSRADHVRSKVLSGANDLTTNGALEALVKHAIYTINQTHSALYSIAEEQGKTGRFLTSGELEKVYDRVRGEALQYAVEFPDSFGAVQAEIAALSKKHKA